MESYLKVHACVIVLFKNCSMLQLSCMLSFLALVLYPHSFYPKFTSNTIFNNLDMFCLGLILLNKEIVKKICNSYLIYILNRHIFLIHFGIFTPGSWWGCGYNPYSQEPTGSAEHRPLWLHSWRIHQHQNDRNNDWSSWNWKHLSAQRL